MSNETIINSDTKRTVGKDAQRNNILAAKLVAQTVRSTLGPKGMDKMLVDPMGDIIVTNDGVTILKEMQIEHPTAKMIVQIAKTQEQEVGDGTTTAVIFAGEFLKNAEELLDRKIHPTTLVKGYHLAQVQAQKILNEIAVPVDSSMEDKLAQIAQTAMTGKGAETSKQLLSQLLVKAVKNIDLDIKAVKFEKKVGGSVEDTQLIQGIVIDKNKVNKNMPSKIEQAKILILSTPLELKDTEIDAKIQITDPSQIQAFLDQEEASIRSKVQKILNSGANVVFVQKGIDDYAQHLLAKAGVLAVRRITKGDIEKLSLATGSNIVNNIDSITESDLGSAGLVEERQVSDEEMIFVSDCENPKSATILVRGGTEHVVGEVHRALDDSLKDIIAALKCGAIVGGAGAVEIKLAEKLRDYAKEFSGREQLAIEAYANAVEIIPIILSENAGLDPINVLADLKSRGDLAWPGINVEEGNSFDSLNAGILEPLKIKTQAIKSATEVAIMILRIDDMIAAKRNADTQMPSMDY